MPKRLEHRWEDGVELKKCSRCHEWKPLDKFCHTTSRWDGLHNECSSCKNGRHQEWRQEHPEENKQQVRDWMAKNPNKLAANRRRWEELHPDQVVAKTQRRRALEMGAEGEVTPEEFEEVRQEYGGICPYCGQRIVDGQFDHIVPLSKGGHHTKDNLVWVCSRCNPSKSDSSLLGFLLRRTTKSL